MSLKSLARAAHRKLVNMKIETHLHSSQTSRCGRLSDENIELEKYFLTVKIMARAIEYLAGKD